MVLDARGASLAPPKQTREMDTKEKETPTDTAHHDVIVKTPQHSLSRLRRRLLMVGGHHRRDRRHSSSLSQEQHQKSNRTAISSSSSSSASSVVEQEQQERSSSSSVCCTVARTLTTRNGSTEALYCPREEARYLLDQGRQYMQAKNRNDDEAMEVLTQALSLVVGDVGGVDGGTSTSSCTTSTSSITTDNHTSSSSLEAHILWTLVSHCVNHQGHQEAASASAYLTVLAPRWHEIQEEWIQQDASVGMLSLLQQHKHWPLALTMSQYVSPPPHSSVLAKLHYETAVSSNLSPSKAMPHLTQALDLLDNNDDRTTTSSSLQQCILQALVQAHAAEHEWEQALLIHKRYMKELLSMAKNGGGDRSSTSSTNANVVHDLAQAYYDASELYLAARRGSQYHEHALSCLEQGLRVLDDHNKNKNKNNQAVVVRHLSAQLLQAKVMTLRHMGRVEDALVVAKAQLLPLVKKQHQQHHGSSSSSSKLQVAKMYYTLACLSSQLGRHDDALLYYCKELKWTRAAMGTKQQQPPQQSQLAISRIYHDLASIHDVALGNYEDALKYYDKAYKVEEAVLRRRARTLSSLERHELEAQVLETQQCMGRIHYKRGDFHKALRQVSSFHSTTTTTTTCNQA